MNQSLVMYAPCVAGRIKNLTALWYAGGEIASFLHAPMYAGSANKTPVVNSVTKVGNTNAFMIQGSRLYSDSDGPIDDALTVTLGSTSPCAVRSAAPDGTAINVTCQAPSAGTHRLHVHRQGYGNANTSTIPELTMYLSVSSITPATGSLAGGTTLTVTGEGFSVHTADMSVSVCGEPCDIVASASSSSSLKCVTRPSPAVALATRAKIAESSLSPQIVRTYIVSASGATLRVVIPQACS